MGFVFHLFGMSRMLFPLKCSPPILMNRQDRARPPLHIWTDERLAWIYGFPSYAGPTSGYVRPLRIKKLGRQSPTQPVLVGVSCLVADFLAQSVVSTLISGGTLRVS